MQSRARLASPFGAVFFLISGRVVSDTDITPVLGYFMFAGDTT